MLGSITLFNSPNTISVEGIGLVGGLQGKGSAECPEQIRKYLSQYILSELSSEDDLNINSLIESLNTAVVIIEGVMPVEDSGKEYFDLKVIAYPGTQTVSLENGWLYHSELKRINTFGINTDILADAEGPIFTDQISDLPIDGRIGYILGGGKVFAKYIIGLVLNNDDFELTNNIRNRLNFRFGRNTARAVKAGIIEVTVPTKYKTQRKKFVELLKTMYVYDIPENEPNRVGKHIQQIINQPESNDGEYALETIGNNSLNQLSILLGAPDEHVRLRAARCMLNLRSDEGMGVLIETVLDKQSPYRIEALEAVTESGRASDASSLAQELMKDESFDIRLAAYEQLHKLNDSSINVKPIASVFYVEKIEQPVRKDIYVTRSGQPKVVLMGTSISCNKGFLIKSANNEITIEAPVDQDYVIVTREFPDRPDLTGNIKCTYELGDIIQALCNELPERGQITRGGLGVSYSDIIALLKQMCDKGAINAQFHAGPIPKIDLNVKK
ncbi:MAG: flagellar basal body P-ring protein FlgI [Sedimentisphaerales bacterium]|nr:flagellar basal body P-ring protein FlgI [Sedimentisphaerales bacterium]